MSRHRWTGFQERIEASDIGRALISAFVVITLVVIVAANLPASELKTKLTRVAGPYTDATGLNQVWGVFAPDPRRQVLLVEARIEYADGSTEVWRPPRGPPFPNSYRDVRWRKWVEVVPLALPQTALWLARSHTHDGRVPTHVEIVQRRYKLLPPGNGPDRTPWETRVLYDLDVTASTLAGDAA
jgi:hypothetical protein